MDTNQSPIDTVVQAITEACGLPDTFEARDKARNFVYDALVKYEKQRADERLTPGYDPFYPDTEFDSGLGEIDGGGA